MGRVVRACHAGGSTRTIGLRRARPAVFTGLNLVLYLIGFQIAGSASLLEPGQFGT